MKIFPVVHVTGIEQSVAEVTRAVRHSVDGVFLIDHDANDARLVEAIRAVRDEFPGIFLGANFIRRALAPALDMLGAAFADDIPVDAIWADNVPALSAGNAELTPVDRRGWDGLHFGGIAFKYQPEVALEDLPALGEAAVSHVDVVTTSGPGTGQAADVSRLHAIRAGIGSTPLAVASGITPENVESYLDVVDHALVATGISRPGGGIDEARLSALVVRAR
ncbi:BtpA/SgcQ family protein [Saccharopolyspora shandongensis]|uniref:BtpA/SgcQ family protein n=1 Tax=Saccharopolyspora shandongensis TaxID=418495 RepID=UPI0033CAE645